LKRRAAAEGLDHAQAAEGEVGPDPAALGVTAADQSPDPAPRVAGIAAETVPDLAIVDALARVPEKTTETEEIGQGPRTEVNLRPRELGQHRGRGRQGTGGIGRGAPPGHQAGDRMTREVVIGMTRATEVTRMTTLGHPAMMMISEQQPHLHPISMCV